MINQKSKANFALFALAVIFLRLVSQNLLAWGYYQRFQKVL